ncbi:MAG: hypothetical protein COY56_06520 [Flavobacteriaceae bacterium CG_4_10_14_0_8_um_filter_34_31]|nr:MAG: hypothetical protein COY56_06520 [Flavobacteriaceae bacterium CG_4_10_14_0_8_um_filter_34_31]
MNNLIVFKTNAFPTFSETFIVSNITAAIDAGFKVKIIVDTINQKSNTSQPAILEEYRLLDKVSKFRQPKGRINRYLKAFKYVLNPLLFYYFLRYLILKKKVSLSYLFILKFYKDFRNTKTFHVHFATAIHPLFELKEIGFLKSNIVVTFHGYDEHGLPKGKPLKNTIHNFNKYVSHITANTQYLKNKLVARGFSEKDIKVIPIGIDTNFFKKTEAINTEIEPFKLITVGRFVEIKGQAYGIETVKLLKDKGYPIVYTLVGYGEELKKLQELVAKLNLEDTVTFFGSGNQDEIKTLLKEQHLFLMTSTSDKSERCETFGVVSLEAQAMGLPIIGFKSGGFPETLVEGITGITVKDKDIEAMASAIENLMLNNDRLLEMGMTAKKHIRDHFDSSIVTCKYLALYV